MVIGRHFQTVGQTPESTSQSYIVLVEACRSVLSAKKQVTDPISTLRCERLSGTQQSKKVKRYPIDSRALNQRYFRCSYRDQAIHAL